MSRLFVSLIDTKYVKRDLTLACINQRVDLLQSGGFIDAPSMYHNLVSCQSLSQMSLTEDPRMIGRATSKVMILAEKLVQTGMGLSV